MTIKASNPERSPATQSDKAKPPSDGVAAVSPWRGTTSRRSFLAGASAGALGLSLLADVSTASAKPRKLSKGDEALLRFPAALETLEADLWQQYNELGGVQDSEVPGGTGSPEYTAALSVLDSDMAQYVHDNTDDEITHFVFLNAYLESRGGEPVDLEPFRTLPSSTAKGAQQIPPAHEPDGADRGHQLVDAVSQQHREPGPRRHVRRRPCRTCSPASFRRSQEAMMT